MKTLIAMVALIGAAAGGAAWLGFLGRAAEPVAMRTAPAERGDLIVTVGATGTLEPEDVIDVGAQVVGRIQEFGPDPRGETDPKFKDKRVDYGTPVSKGAVLARIDPRVYKAQFDQAKAALDRAIADLLQLEAKLLQTDAEWKRAEKLHDMTVSNRAAGATGASRTAAVPIQAISNSDYILAKANYDVAKANVEVGKSVIEQQRGILALAQTNLEYTVIVAPAEGTIIDRRVNIGQTVVSSMNAPSLFLLALDLRRMQVWASVNEADIGQLVTGTPVHFTVDAFPGDTFHGTVEQIRLNASMTQNVVTYTVVVSVDNSNMKLLPYLTADVKFEVHRREGVLQVPNAAPRFEPRPEQVAAASSGEAVQPEGDHRVIWVQHGDLLEAIPVKVGVTDGANTEISGEQIHEGMRVVIGEPLAAEAEAVNNPFAPKFGRGKSK